MLILKGVKVVYFVTLLEVLILKVVSREADGPGFSLERRVKPYSAGRQNHGWQIYGTLGDSGRTTLTELMYKDCYPIVNRNLNVKPLNAETQRTLSYAEKRKEPHLAQRKAGSSAALGMTFVGTACAWSRKTIRDAKDASAPACGRQARNDILGD